MAIQMINGYSCSNCAEVALAKRGIDPQEDPAKPKSVSVAGLERDRAVGADPSEAVDAASDTAAQRAPLSYTQNLDKLA
ncbi:MAG: hypothetical protein CFE31_14350 [Rhizobiales bacterium PAR1]|nr:MAG: hypothetical protein CFE31_14350 [Rhizobiales bacterium PAR1]